MSARSRPRCANCGATGHNRTTCTLSKTARGRAMRLAGCDFKAREIVDAVEGCSLEEAKRHIRERNKRVKANRPLWSDTGATLPPPEAQQRDTRRRNYG